MGEGKQPKGRKRRGRAGEVGEPGVWKGEEGQVDEKGDYEDGEMRRGMREEEEERMRQREREKVGYEALRRGWRDEGETGSGRGERKTRHGRKGWRGR